jgi:predicted CopG family antitoxin
VDRERGWVVSGKDLTETAYNYVHMSRSIRLSEDGYERLAAHKREDGTFSDVVLRLAGERSLVELAGILTDDETDAMREAVEERRTRREEDLEAVADEMRGGRVVLLDTAFLVDPTSGDDGAVEKARNRTGRVSTSRFGGIEAGVSSDWISPYRRDPGSTRFRARRISRGVRPGRLWRPATPVPDGYRPSRRRVGYGHPTSLPSP